MDVVVVTHAADADLLQYFLASYELYYKSKSSLILFTRRADNYLWEDIRLPPNTRLIYREDFPELVEDDFRNQIYLKLIAHRFVQTEYFWLVDSDFLIVAPCGDEDLLPGGKPAWFFSAWSERLSRWRQGSEIIAGDTIPYTDRNGTWIFSRTVAAELDSRLQPVRSLSIGGVSEFALYGWFAHAYFPASHQWVDPDNPAIRPITALVNQVPPDYCHLDPQCSYAQYQDTICVAFWSHWDLARQKMHEFFVDSQRRHFGEVRVEPAFPPIFPNLVIDGSERKSLPAIKGVYLDGWVRDKVWFGLEPQSRDRRLCIGLMVPANPANTGWSITGSYSMAGGDMAAPFAMSPGWSVLRVPVPASRTRQKVILLFPDGFRLPESPDPRIFRARMESLGWES